MTDYERLQESIGITGKYILPVLAKYELENDKLATCAIIEAFQAGLEYAVAEMKPVAQALKEL